MTGDTDEVLRRMSAESGVSPRLETDPRAVRCECGAILYPGQICECRCAAAAGHCEHYWNSAGECCHCGEEPND